MPQLRRRKHKKEEQEEVVLDEIIMKRKLKSEREFATLMVSLSLSLSFFRDILVPFYFQNKAKIEKIKKVLKVQKKVAD